MDKDDVIRTEDLAAVRAATTRTRRLVLGATLAILVVSSVLAGVASYFLMLHSIPAAAFVGLIFALAGAFQLLRWQRHYRGVFQQLDLLDRKVASGEVMYGSQVKFY